ncbi:MAG: hypothetical protein K2Q14_08095 [Gammaproteobacteria bacterium]|nr:hypothetical protein [Gammaproteobacteria bacterium]
MNKKLNYVSEIDELLADLRSALPESVSQRDERLKGESIAAKRDNVQTEKRIEIWEEF